MKIMFIDTETGGLDPNLNSILSIALLAYWDGQIHDRLHIFIKEPIMHVTPHAIELNKIDLSTIRKIGLTPQDAVVGINAFINKNFNGEEDIILAGHNTSFDHNYLKRLIKLSESGLTIPISHRKIDTANLLFFLTDIGILKVGSFSLWKASKQLGIKLDDLTEHDALSDAILTARLYYKLCKMVENK